MCIAVDDSTPGVTFMCWVPSCVGCPRCASASAACRSHLIVQKGAGSTPTTSPARSAPGALLLNVSPMCAACCAGHASKIRGPACCARLTGGAAHQLNKAWPLQHGASPEAAGAGSSCPQACAFDSLQHKEGAPGWAGGAAAACAMSGTNFSGRALWQHSDWLTASGFGARMIHGGSQAGCWQAASTTTVVQQMSQRWASCS
jgi:hypothetical protein